MSSETPVLAETSYGCQKQIIELYVYDYGRKGFLETRSVRLPTVAIRSGAVRPPHPYIGTDKSHHPLHHHSSLV
jgi:hypothetical protein